MKKIITLFTLILICSGCLNLSLHLYHGSVTTVYEPTKIVWNDCVCCWSKNNMNKDPIGCSIVRFTYPFWLIDFPCEVILDTVTFPYDLYKKCNYSHRSINERTIYKIAPETFKE